MEKPTLHLIVDKGPKKKVETLEFKLGTPIRIGRVVKGNTFSIKDPGISQKHLLIEFNHNTSQWFISDLDTSNGTVLNGSQIPPSVRFPLSDGDSIKIGEMTSISVKISGIEPEEEEEEGGLRRERRRVATRARSKAGSLDLVVEGGNLEAPARNGAKGRGHPKKSANSVRVSKKDEILDSVVEDSVEVPNLGRGRRADNPAIVSKKDEMLDLVAENSIEVPKNAGRGRRAAGRTRVTSGRVSKEEVAGKWESMAQVNVGDEGNLAGSGGDEEVVRVEEGGDNMETMTLGEWFNRMEKFLPQAL